MYNRKSGGFPVKSLGACILLLLAAMAWGSGFAIAKRALDTLPPCFILMVRFGIGTLILFPFLWKRLRAASRKTWVVGLVVGLFVAVGHIIQLVGMRYTTAGKCAFLSAVYVILVPFLVWAAGGRIPTAWNLTAACLCFAGVGMISLNSGLIPGLGEILSLIGGIFFGLQIATVSLYASDCDMMVIAWITMLVSSVIAAIPAFIFEPHPTAISVSVLAGILYLAVFCSVFALSAQNIGIKYAPAAVATILLSMESVFGCLAGALLLQEAIDAKMLVGCAMIFVSLLVSNLHTKSQKQPHRQEE